MRQCSERRAKIQDVQILDLPRRWRVRVYPLILVVENRALKKWVKKLNEHFLVNSVQIWRSVCVRVCVCVRQK